MHKNNKVLITCYITCSLNNLNLQKHIPLNSETSYTCEH